MNNFLSFKVIENKIQNREKLTRLTSSMSQAFISKGKENFIEERSEEPYFIFSNTSKDHIIEKAKLKSAKIYPEVLGSDHCPVEIVLN